MLMVENAGSFRLGVDHDPLHRRCLWSASGIAFPGGKYQSRIDFPTRSGGS
jgi:hypothetical protein